MVKHVNVLEKQDPSVDELLNKTAKELKEKYNKQRKIKFKLLNKKTPIQKVLSVLLDIFFVVMLLVAFIVCFSCLNSSLNGFTPSFMGCTNMVVATKSMEKSGYYVGDAIVIRYVKTETLNVNDKIAFYVYPHSYRAFDESKAENVSDEIKKTKLSLTFAELFGFRNNEMKQAKKANSELVFHHIRAIYVDQDGTRWFKTYGSSNSSDDIWWVKDTMVVGIEDDTFISTVMSKVIDASAKPIGIAVVVTPAVIMLFWLIICFMQNVQIAKLELDCVEEKRKITDPICVKYKVGYQMSNKSKYKILAQATDKNREEYIKLLWKDGHMPDSIKKYYLRKRILLNPNKDLLKLNRKCEQMFKRGTKPTTIAKFYLKEKQQIENRYETIKKRLKSIDAHKSNNKKT